MHLVGDTSRMSTRIKICGITRQADADAVVDAGAHALGLNFAEESPRRVELARARAIAGQVRGALIRVGLFMDPAPDQVARVLDTVELDVLQFHGSETADLCRSFGMPFMKAFRMREPLPPDAVDEYSDACCLLLDAYVNGLGGGTGQRFDWNLWPGSVEQTPPRPHLVLAGGLTPENAAEAVVRLAPWGVDVSGGVEGPVKGEKDPDRIRRFVREVQRAGS